MDIEGLPDGDTISGYTIDICNGDPEDPGTQCGMGEQGTGIDIQTGPCPPGVGTALCEAWSMTPDANTDPLTYHMTIDAVGAASSIDPHVLRIRVRPAVGDGTTVSKFTMTLISPSHMEGAGFWTWGDGTGDRCDNGTGTLTVTKQ